MNSSPSSRRLVAPQPQSRDGLVDWPAVLTEDFEDEDWDWDFPKGQKVVIRAGRNNDWSIKPQTVYYAIPIGHNRAYKIPAEKLDIGPRDVTRGIIFMINGMITNLINWNLFGDSDYDASSHLADSDRFGRIFFEFAKGLRANAGPLIALGCDAKVFGLLSREFHQTVGTILDSISDEHKRVLSADSIDFSQLDTVIEYDRNLTICKSQLPEVQMVVYLRLYLPSPTMSTESRRPVGVYIGMSNNLHLRDLRHISETRRYNLPTHEQGNRKVQELLYGTAARAHETRVVVLCKLGAASRSVVYLAEKLFTMFFDSYTQSISPDEDIRTASRPVRASITRVTREIRGAATERSLFRPHFEPELNGLNLASPLTNHDRGKADAQWYCTELPDRHVFRAAQLRKLKRKKTRPGVGFTILRGDKNSFRLPLKVHFSGDHIALTVEVMKDGQPHPYAYASLPSVGPVSDFSLVNTVGILVIGRDLENHLFGIHCQGQDVRHMTSLTLNGQHASVPLAYVRAMKIRNTLLQHRYSSRLGEKLMGRPAKVYEFEHNFKLAQVNMVMKPASADRLPSPHFVGVQDNRQILEEKYHLRFTDNLQGERCDMCFLAMRNWRALSTHSSNRTSMKHLNFLALTCNVTQGVCDSWRKMAIPVTYTNPERLKQLEGDLFFPRPHDEENLAVSERSVLRVFKPSKDESAKPEISDKNSSTSDNDTDTDEECSVSDDDSDVDEEYPASEDNEDSEMQEGGNEESLEVDVEHDDSDAQDEDDDHAEDEDGDEVEELLGLSIHQNIVDTPGLGPDGIPIVRAKRRDKLSRIGDVRDIAGTMHLLVYLNDEEHPAWVADHDLNHQRAILHHYWLYTSDPDMPLWVRKPLRSQQVEASGSN